MDHRRLAVIARKSRYTTCLIHAITDASSKARYFSGSDTVATFERILTLESTSRRLPPEPDRKLETRRPLQIKLGKSVRTYTTRQRCTRRYARGERAARLRVRQHSGLLLPHTAVYGVLLRFRTSIFRSFSSRTILSQERWIKETYRSLLSRPHLHECRHQCSESSPML